MLGIFAKFPDLEPVKTRLQPRLSRHQAAAFHLAALADVLETACRTVPHPVLFLSRGAAEPARVGETLQASGLDPAAWEALRVVPQQGADLGARLEDAFESLCGDPPRPALIVGSDSPTLGVPMLHAAFAELARTDAVLGPATDGGYWCIGLRVPRRGILAGIPWSTPETFAATRARLEACGLSLGVLETWTDVDVVEDFVQLICQIAACRAAGDGLTARHTERILAALGIAVRVLPAPDAG